MKPYLIGWAVTALVFLALDSIWLSQMTTRFYRPLIGEMLAAKVELAPAVAFYLIYVTGLAYFGVSLAGSSVRTAMLHGAALGLLAYGAYDLTNQATMKVWDIRITLADICWGMFASATAAGAAQVIVAKFR